MNDFRDRLSRHVDDATPDRAAPFGEVLARRDQRRRRRRALAASGTAMVAVAAIAVGTQLAGPGSEPDSTGPSTSGPSPTETRRPEPTYEWTNEPSPVVLRLADRDVKLRPYTYCWNGPPSEDGTSAGMCADGFAKTADLEDVGGPASVDFWFGVAGWRFTATFTEIGADCPRSFSVPAETTGDQTFRVDPVGPAGRYRVELFGRGNEQGAGGPGGDVVTSFVWTTPNDGPIEQPEAYLALVTDDDTGYSSYGVELGVSDLAFQPREASASVTVTSATGESATFAPPREHGGTADCYAEGSLFFSERDMDSVARQVAALGGEPFTYRVVLTIDGQEYVGTAVWPRDEKKDEAPNTVLTFEPPLPAYTGD